MKIKNFILTTSVILLIFNTFAISIAHWDEFFLDNVIDSQPELTQLDEINIVDWLSFSDKWIQYRYSSSKKFVTLFKKALKNSYENGKYDYYTVTDVINNFDYMTFSLSRYFANYKRYEQTGNEEFFNLANDFLEESKTYYMQMKFALNN